MLPFVFRRALLRPGILSIAQMLPARAVLSNQHLAVAAQRHITTTTNDPNSESTAESESKSKAKSTRRKTGSSTKVDKAQRVVKVKKAETKKKIVINPQDLPPKPPGTPFALWFSEWCRSQPKIDNIQTAQNTVIKGAQIWHTVSDHEKQQYREKFDSLRVEYKRRIEEWREQVDPAVLRELNRRRMAKGRSRIRGRGTGRPLSGFIRYFLHARDEYPRTEEDHKTYFKNLPGRVATQWKAMSDTEKAIYTDPARADLAAWREKRSAESQAKKHSSG